MLVRDGEDDNDSVIGYDGVDDADGEDDYDNDNDYDGEAFCDGEDDYNSDNDYEEEDDISPPPQKKAHNNLFPSIFLSSAFMRGKTFIENL